MNILVIDSSPPCDLLQGNSLIGYHLFRRLCDHHRLTLVCPTPVDAVERTRRALADVFDRMYLIPREKPVATLAGVVEPELARRNISLGGRIDVAAVRKLLGTIEDVVRETEFDVIHTRLLSMASTVFHVRHPCKLLELVDSETLRSERRAGVDRPKFWSRVPVARLLESTAVRRFDACTTVSAADSRAIKRLAPRVPVRTIPNGVDTQLFAPIGVTEDSEAIIFTGAMSFPPNVAAVLYFYNKIFPLIRREVKQAHFIIAGRDPAPEIRRLRADPAVSVTGYVEDLPRLIARSAVYVCPMVTGSGIKNKVLEAMAMGRPIVSSPLGVEALEVKETDLCVADGPEEFAEAVMRLLRDPGLRSRLGKSARKRVMDEYSWDACAAAYDDLYESVLHGRRVRNGGEPCRQAA